MQYDTTGSTGALLSDWRLFNVHEAEKGCKINYSGVVIERSSGKYCPRHDVLLLGVQGQSIAVFSRQT